MPEQETSMLEERESQPVVGRPYIPDYGIPETLEGVLPWSYFCKRMEESLVYWIGTTDAEGRPHATPIWGVWLDGTLYFDGSPRTRRGRNLTHNPAVVVHLEDGKNAVILQGEAPEIHGVERELAERLSRVYSAKYKPLGYEPGPDTWNSGGLYRVRPRMAFAWREFPKDATRWTFA